MTKLQLRAGRHNWPLSFKLKRLCWLLCWTPLAIINFRHLSKLRIFVLRRFGAKIGKGCLVAGRVKILMPWNLKLGDEVKIAEGVDLYNFAEIQIGSYVVISRGAFLCTGTHDHNDSMFPLLWKSIVISDYCWLAAECAIAPGCTIGEGAVVGMRSMVTKPVEPWDMVGGNPAKTIGKRNIKEK